MFNPYHGNFESHDYPVVKLSRKGNPILLIHPHSHILIPTQSRVEKMHRYERESRSLTRVTWAKPVGVTYYGGQQHFGELAQLIVFNDGHHRTYSAWARHEPIYVEFFGGSSYYPFSQTWRRIPTR